MKKNRIDKEAGRTRIKYFCILCSIFCVLVFVIYGVVYAEESVIMAKEVSGELPLDPDNSIWKSFSSVEVFLNPQNITKPEIYEAMIKHLHVRALYNTKEIAFRIEWEDPTEDYTVNIDKFSDAAALQFLSSEATVKDIDSTLFMGNKDNAVNIWFWKASWQEEGVMERTYAKSDDFVAGILAENPVSKLKTPPVENIIARGFGSVTDIEKTEINVSSFGRWQSNRWAIVFKRSLTSKDKFEVNFKEIDIIPVAFAIWNGSEGHRGARKVFSLWYTVRLEKE